jgi:hypothetical protein
LTHYPFPTTTNLANEPVNYHAVKTQATSYKLAAAGGRLHGTKWALYKTQFLMIFINIGIIEIQIPNRMAHLVRNFLLFLIIIFIGSCSPSNTEKTNKEEGRTNEITFDCGYDCELGDWLRKDIPFNQPGTSTPAWAFFYFKVNSSGEIDSLYHRGTIRKEIIEIFEQNIYKTRGHWKIPDSFGASDYQWFVFPYFDLGEIPCFSGANCTREDSIIQSSMRSLLWNMGDLERAVKDRSAKLVFPAYAGGVSQECSATVFALAEGTSGQGTSYRVGKYQHLRPCW